jgi:ABC-type Na+ efflux pump permease subunit
MLKVLKLELKKSVKKYSKNFIFIIILLSVFSGLLASHSVNSRINSDKGFYTVASPYKIEDSKFIQYRMEAQNFKEYENIDIYLGKSTDFYILLRNSERSHAATDELRKTIHNKFEEKLYEEYGEDAFPVFIHAIYLKRELIYQPEITNEEASEKDTEEREEVREKIVEEEENEVVNNIEQVGGDGIIAYEDTGYKTPDDFTPPSLIGKMLYAFFFILPSYFAIQVFSSSLIEDRVTRRIDVLLSTPISEIRLLTGKLVPYITISVITVAITSFLFNKSQLSLAFVFPVVLFFAALQMFLALVSRSYREMTFLVIASSLVVTSYIFIPSIFGGTIPVSKVSPITLMLAMFEGEEIAISDYVFATFQFYSMGIVLIYLSSKALNPEVMYKSDLSGRLLTIAQKSVKKDYHTFFAAIASIPFVFMIEFLLLSVLFIMPLERSILVFLFVVAFVEEIFKGTAVFAASKNGANIYKSSIFCATGFFVGEKFIVFINVATKFNNLLFAQYMLLPFFIHIISLFVFAALMKRSFRYAIVASTLVHFIYNYTVVSML